MQKTDKCEGFVGFVMECAKEMGYILHGDVKYNNSKSQETLYLMHFIRLVNTKNGLICKFTSSGVDFYSRCVWFKPVCKEYWDLTEHIGGCIHGMYELFKTA